MSERPHDDPEDHLFVPDHHAGWTCAAPVPAGREGAESPARGFCGRLESASCHVDPRITEAELREIEARGVVAIPGAPMPPSQVVREDYRSLVAEVRRLRGLIMAQDDSADRHVYISDEFHAEAEAIRRER
jgi:hypothetical protein